MALVVKNRVQESSTTTGTGAFTLAGAYLGYQRFSAVCSTNDTLYYCIEALDSNGNPSGDWETGLGTYSGTNTLTRTTVVESSNANAAVNFAAGNKRVMMAATASYLTHLTSMAGLTFAQGDILYYNGTKLTNLGPGTSGQFLKTQGAGANPVWAAAGGGGYEGGPAGTIPSIGGMTGWNLGTSSIASSSHSHIFSPQNGGVGRGYYQAVPAAPFDIYMRYYQTNWPSADASPQNWSGILLRNNSGGASLICGFNGTSSPRHEMGRFASAGSTGSSAFSLFSEHYGRSHWVRVNVTSTTVTQYVGYNGYDWLQIGTETISTHITAVTHYGFASYENSTNPGAVFIDYLSTTAPA